MRRNYEYVKSATPAKFSVLLPHKPRIDELAVNRFHFVGHVLAVQAVMLDKADQANAPFLTGACSLPGHCQFMLRSNAV